ncbi:MAG TPA: hypothetical protein VML35_02175 [Gaiellaceae bacterium]|nr:hypothetical protein [Gaiellaceae bacterium]
MTGERAERIGAASGIAFAALVILGFFVAGRPPKLADGAAPLAQYFADNRGGILIAAYLGGLAIAFFVWFLGSLATTLRSAGEERMATIAVGGGLVAAALAIGGIGISASLAHAAPPGGVIAAASVEPLYRLEWLALTAASFPIAALAWATAVAVFRTGVLPRWVAWLSTVGTIVFLIGGATFARDGLFAPDGAWALLAYFAFVAWTAVVSAVLVQHVGAPREAPKPATAAT